MGPNTHKSRLRARFMRFAPFRAFIYLGDYAHDKYYIVRLWYMLYDSKSILLHIFASQQVWCMVHKLIDEQNEEFVKDFRVSQQSECSAVALAVSPF